MMISVVMPVARIDEYLRETLSSVNNQTFRDFELILICSADIHDGLAALLDAYRFDFPVRTIQAKLRGVAFAANLGIENSRGKFIARWDADDLCDPNRFHKQLEEFEKHPGLGVVGTRVMLVDDKGHPIEIQKFKLFESDAAIRRALKYRQPLLHSSLMFRKEVLFEARGYLYGHTSEDHEMFIRIARNPEVRFANLPNVVTYYRRHPSQLSDLSNQKNQFYEIAAFMFSEFLRTCDCLYLFGIVVNIPLLRRMRHRYRALRQLLRVKSRVSG